MYHMNVTFSAEYFNALVVIKSLPLVISNYNVVKKS